MAKLETEKRELNKDWKTMEEKVKRAIEDIQREKGEGKEKRRRWWDEKDKEKRDEKGVKGMEKEGKLRCIREVDMSIKIYVKERRGRKC